MITPADFAGPRRPPTGDEQRAIHVYATLMAEIRDRIDSVRAIFEENIRIAPRARLEFAFLQERMILETLALACLVAHGDLKEVQSSQLQKAYQADFIVKRLERMHPDFFPVPHTMETDDGVLLGGPRVHHFREAEGARLTKSDVVSAYAKAGTRLHRGSLKGLSRRDVDPQAEADEIVVFVGRLIALLGAHHIMTKDREKVFVCTIPESSDGEVRVLFATVSSDRDPTAKTLAIAEPVEG